MAKFDKKKFDPAFQQSIQELQASEKITKAVLMALSRSVLEAVQATEDSGYINQVVNALTPVNRKVAILFFTALSGFRADNGVFGKKDKKNYEAIKEAAIIFLDDPHNNIWTWAEREVDVEPKAFTMDKVTKTVESLFKKAAEAKFTDADVIRAMFKGGIDVEALTLVLVEMGLADAPKDEAPAMQGEGIGGA